jgi:PEP-CTERM motif
MRLSINSIALTITVLGMSLGGAARAGFIDNSTVTVLPSSSPAYPGYPQADAIDTGANRYITDFASFGQGAATHLDFQFLTPETFSQIIETDRTSSGGGNGSNVQGAFDFNTSYEYIFSNDPTFATNVGIVQVLGRPQPTTGVLASFQTTTAIPDITALYLRWQVLATNGSNPGAADFQFSSVPEPASLTLLGLGGFTLLGYVGLRRRKRTQPA